MYEYLPWSKNELGRCLREYKNGIFSILDIELSGACNFHCIYCDSPERNKSFEIDLEKIRRILQAEKIRWLYICGLGEPSFGKNREILLQLLQMAEEYKVRCSIFTNLSGVSGELMEYVDRGILYLLFKLDSLSSKKLEELYGIGQSKQQLARVEKIARHVVVRDGCTNLAASIVPTRINADEIQELIRWCLERGIYPLVAELENAGAGEKSFERLSLPKEELARIKWDTIALCSEEIRVPVCPAMISGIHLDHKGTVIVDRSTGYSCHWFWLRNPEIMEITSVYESNSWDEYSKKVREYRMSKTDEVRRNLEDCDRSTYVFGGCGGSIEELLLGHLALHVRQD